MLISVIFASQNEKAKKQKKIKKTYTICQHQTADMKHQQLAGEPSGAFSERKVNVRLEL